MSARHTFERSLVACWYCLMPLLLMTVPVPAYMHQPDPAGLYTLGVCLRSICCRDFTV